MDERKMVSLRLDSTRIAEELRRIAEKLKKVQEQQDYRKEYTASSKKLKRMWNEAKKRNRPHHEIIELQRAYELAKKEGR